MYKRYKRKPQSVTVLKTYHGQPMSDIKSFLLGSNIHFNIPEDGSDREPRFKDNIEGDLGITPGDYILRSDNGEVTSCTADEFEKVYEVEVNSHELHYVITNYGFPVDAAEMMLSDELIRPILLAPLIEQNKASKRTDMNFYIHNKQEVDINRIAGEFNRNLLDKTVRY